MSLDPDPVDQLLDRHGKHWLATFNPLPLEGALAVAIDQQPHRTRWLWPVAAAVALLVIPLLTVVGISGSLQSAHHPAGYLGDFAWNGAVLNKDPRTLTIAVDINRIRDYCLDDGLPAVRAVVSETATKVTIRAQAFEPSHPSPTPSVPPGTVLACSLRGYRPVMVTVRLEQPLGTRSLLDAKTGARHQVVDASKVPAPSWLPAGYVDLGFQRYDDDSDQVLHRYDAGKAELRVVRGHGFPAPANERGVTTATVLGQPAKVTAPSKGVTNEACVIWDDSEYSWSICSVGGPAVHDPPLSAAELLRIANSLR